MKHLYSLAFVLVTLASFNHLSAQTIVTTNASAPGFCDGSATYSDYASYPGWNWTWYKMDTVTVIASNGTTVWFSTLGIDEQLLDAVTIYPNPFTNVISVDNKDGVIRSLKLMDLNGRVLSEMPAVNSGLVEMNELETLSSGTYLLILSGEICTTKPCSPRRMGFLLSAQGRKLDPFY